MGQTEKSGGIFLTALFFRGKTGSPVQRIGDTFEKEAFSVSMVQWEKRRSYERTDCQEY